MSSSWKLSGYVLGALGAWWLAEMAWLKAKSHRGSGARTHILAGNSFTCMSTLPDVFRVPRTPLALAKTSL